MILAVRRPLPHTWPDETQRQVLRAALLSGDDAVAAWRSIAPRFDPHRLPGVERLVPLLAENLRRVRVRDAPFDEMEAIRARAEARNTHLFAHGAELIGALDVAGIPTLLLKGAAMAEPIYGGRGLRPMGDLDLLVPIADAAAAAAVAEREGWVPRDRVTPSFRRVRHAAHFAAADGCQLDLHWHVFEQCCRADDDDRLWAASLPAALAGAPSRVLAPADQLLHAVIHGLTWVRTPGIRWLADASLLIDRAAIDWERLAREARRRHFPARTRLALAYLHAHLARPVPRWLLARLASDPACQLERVEHAALSREPGVLGELPVYLCRYVREADGRGPAAIIGFGRYLQEAWELSSMRDVPRAAISRARHRMAVARTVVPGGR